MNLDNLGKRLLVAASQVPRDRDPKSPEAIEDLPVTGGQLCRGQEPAQWIIDVGVGACLVEHDVTPGHPVDVMRDVVEEVRGLGVQLQARQPA